MQYIM